MTTFQLNTFGLACYFIGAITCSGEGFPRWLAFLIGLTIAIISHIFGTKTQK